MRTLPSTTSTSLEKVDQQTLKTSRLERNTFQSANLYNKNSLSRERISLSEALDNQLTEVKLIEAAGLFLIANLINNGHANQIRYTEIYYSDPGNVYNHRLTKNKKLAIDFCWTYYEDYTSYDEEIRIQTRKSNKEEIQIDVEDKIYLNKPIIKENNKTNKSNNNNYTNNNNNNNRIVTFNNANEHNIDHYHSHNYNNNPNRNTTRYQSNDRRHNNQKVDHYHTRDPNKK